MKKIRTLKNHIQTSQKYLILTILIFLAFFFFIKEIYNIQVLFSAQINSIASLVSRNISASLMFADAKESKRILQTLKDQEIIESAYVYDPDGHYVASVSKYSKDQIIKIDTEFLKTQPYLLVNYSEGLVHYYYSIKEGDEIVGYLELRVSIMSLIINLLLDLMVLIFIAITTFYVASYLSKKNQYKLSAPLEKLAIIINEIMGKQDYLLRVNIDSSNEDDNVAEIYELTTKFNELLSMISEREKDLRMINEHLEELIIKRTKERDIEREKSIQASKMSALGVMSAGIAHEINNPLAAIKGAAHILQKMIDKGVVDEKLIGKISSDVTRLVDRIAKIIKGLKNVSREGGNDPFEKASLFAIIDESLSFCKKRFEHNGVAIRTQLGQEDITIVCRAVQISQVLLNLLNNAYDAIEVFSERWVEVVVIKEKETVYIKVRDSGHGVPPAIQEKLFEPFFTTKEVGKGTGLGLSISIGIMNAHNGRLFVDNTDKNTCFVLELPIDSKNLAEFKNT